MKRTWKAVISDWTHIQTFSTDGKLACLNDQQRQTLLSFMQVGFWQTRWTDAPNEDTLNAFMSGIENELMNDCDFVAQSKLNIRQTGCKIELMAGDVIISSFTLDATDCGLLNAGGQGTEVVAPGEDTEEQKTALFSGAMALIIYCQEAILDAFNALEVFLEMSKAAAAWLEVVPLLDMSPAFEIIEALDSFNELLESLFEATDTTEWREAMACQIMCWCVTNNFIVDSSIIDKWRDYLTAQGINPPDHFYSIFVDVASYKALLDRFALGMNDGNEDWIVLCDACLALFGEVTFDDVEEDLDYTLTYGDVESVGNPDLGLDGEEYTVPPFDTGRRATMLIELGATTKVIQVKYDWNYANFVGGEIAQHIYLYDAEMEELEHWADTLGGAQNEWRVTSEAFDQEGVDFVRVSLQFVCDYTGAKHIWLDNVQIYHPEP